MIFLSYAKEDGKRAAAIFAALNRADRPVFYDKDALMPGMDWRYEIEEKVHASRLIIILLSKSSVSKEGFVQREIRLALDRAENMPDGRVFIIPVRLDDVTVPRKLAKYQWLDLPHDEEIVDLEFAVDFAIPLLKTAPSDGSSDPVEFDKSLLRERVVLLLQGKNVEGVQIYTYLRLPLWKLQKLRDVLRAHEDFMPADFGTILHAGQGEPSDELRAQMAEAHDMGNIWSRDSALKNVDEVRRMWLIGFSEGYWSIRGANAALPPAQPDLSVLKPEAALRDGLRKGIEMANLPNPHGSSSAAVGGETQWVFRPPRASE